MTRINLIPVWELSDQHLIAEYRELPRVIKQIIDIKNAPIQYKLGAGHMKWASLHNVFCMKRYYELCKEMEYRGFKVSFPAKDLEKYMITKRLDYIPNENDIKISRDRIIEKLNMKPDWYKWTGRNVPDYALKLL